LLDAGWFPAIWHFDMLALPCEPPRTIPGVSSQTRRVLRWFFDAVTRISPALAARFALALFTIPVPQVVSPEARAVLRVAAATTVSVGGEPVRVFRWQANGPPAANAAHARPIDSTSGSGGARPTVLLAHGWSSRAARLTAFVEPLRRAGFSVVAFDAPAHGESSGVQLDMSSYVDALRTVIERAGPVHGIIGHSFGGRASLLLLAAAQLTDVRAIALLAVPPDVSYMLEQFKLVLNLRRDVQHLLDRAFAARFGAPPERHSPEEHAHPIRTSTLLLHDSDDDVAPIAHACALARQLPTAQLIITRGLNHCGLLTHPPAIDAITAFMTKTCA
jgi:pimeloyl-ACP methyl ester carboxylesterase